MCLFSFLHCDPDVKIFSLALRHGTQLVVMAVTTRPFFFNRGLGGLGQLSMVVCALLLVF